VTFNKLITIFIVFLFWTQSNKVKGQNLDSLKTKQAQTTVFDSSWCNLTNRIAWLEAKTNPQESEKLALQALSFAKQNSWSIEEASSYNTLGVIYRNRGDYTKSLDFYMQSLKIYESLNVVSKVGISYNNIAVVHMYNENYSKAKEFFGKALEIFNEINDDEGKALALNNLGIIAYYENDLTTSIQYFEQSLEIERKSNNQQGIAESITNIGVLYMHNQQFDKAEKHLKESYEIEKQLGNKTGMTSSLANMAENYIAYKKYNEAEKALEEALVLVNEAQAEYEKINIYFNYYSLYEAKNQPKEALEYYVLFANTKDSLLSLEKNQQLSELQTQYETEKKQQQIDLLNKEKAIQNLSLKQKNYQIILLIISFISIIFVSLYFYNKQKIKQREITQKAELEKKQLKIKAIIEGQENERKRLASDLHDGLGQLLSTVKLNVSSFEENVDDEAKKTYQTSIQLIDEACDELRNISHNLMPKTLIKFGLEKALYEMFDKINQTNKIKVNFQTVDFNKRLSDINEITLFRVIQELTNNTLKYAQATKIEVQIVVDEEEINISVEDNGVGFDTQANTNGQGISNIKERLADIGAVVEFSSNKKTGTSIMIFLPVKEGVFS
jgi:two-component system, NarL family, sensor kinase